MREELGPEALRQALLNAQSYDDLHQLINTYSERLEAILKNSTTDEFKNAFEAKCKALIDPPEPKPTPSPSSMPAQPQASPTPESILPSPAPKPQPNRVEALQLYQIVSEQKTRTEALVAYQQIQNLPPAPTPTPAPRPPTPFNRNGPQ